MAELVTEYLPSCKQSKRTPESESRQTCLNESGQSYLSAVSSFFFFFFYLSFIFVEFINFSNIVSFHFPGLSFYTTQQQLESLFSPFGVLTEGVYVSLCTPLLSFLTPPLLCCFSYSSFAATLITDQNTQRPKGFGFVSYKSEIEAEKARKALNGRVILTFSYLYIMP